VIVWILGRLGGFSIGSRGMLAAAGSTLSGIMLAVMWLVVFDVPRIGVVFILFVSLPGLLISTLWRRSGGS